jgi:hypothetical protein
MLRYAHIYDIQRLILILINRNVYYRHDCYFEHYQNEPSLLQEKETNRLVDTFLNEIIKITMKFSGQTVRFFRGTETLHRRKPQEKQYNSKL